MSVQDAEKPITFYSRVQGSVVDTNECKGFSQSQRFYCPVYGKTPRMLGSAVVVLPVIQQVWQARNFQDEGECLNERLAG